MPTTFVGESATGAYASAAMTVTGRRSELATLWLTADMRPRHTHERHRYA